MLRQHQALTNLGRDETVLLFPTYGFLDAGNVWRIPVSGVVFDDGDVTFQKRLLLKLLQRVLKAPPDEYESDLFRRRIRGFIASTMHGRRIAVQLGEMQFRLQKPSKRNGLFRGVLHLPDEDVGRLTPSGNRPSEKYLDLDVLTQHGDARRAAGRVHLLPDTGISIISDIDDTIKQTDVTSRDSLLANTFLREFSAVSGMAEVYQSWAEQGGVFHYVSSSPWQLYDCLAELFDEASFPRGTMHLRNFRLRNHMVGKLLRLRRPGKVAVMKRLLRTFPKRHFILVGDSGERDPEIYGALARRHPQQIRGIYVRELPDRPLDRARRQKAFRRLPDDLCRIFREARELPRFLKTKTS